MAQSEPEVHTFPSGDEPFRAVVAKTMELHRPATPDELAGLLRPAYQAVAVRERARLAEIPGSITVWYALRDGEGHLDDRLTSSAADLRAAADGSVVVEG